jgi:hypothetical protein
MRLSQIRTARALLKWSAHDLARTSALGVNTISRRGCRREATKLQRRMPRALDLRTGLEKTVARYLAHRAWWQHILARGCRAERIGIFGGQTRCIGPPGAAKPVDRSRV